MTLIPIYLDYMDITIPETLWDTSLHRNYVLPQLAVASWDILNKYNTLANNAL